MNRIPDAHPGELQDQLVDLRLGPAAMHACITTGGSIAHHHGMRRLKADLIEEQLGPGAAALQRRVKTALDTTSVLNPGALLPIDRR